MNTSVDLSRFVDAHKKSYQTALKEITNGRKCSHWMWFIFPQVYGLGKSTTSQYYAIKSKDEAVAFLSDPYLGSNLREISEALLHLKTSNPTEVFGKPDDYKLKSSMTLFATISEDNSVFHKVLNKYYDGRQDMRTIRFLSEMLND